MLGIWSSWPSSRPYEQHVRMGWASFRSEYAGSWFTDSSFCRFC